MQKLLLLFAIVATLSLRVSAQPQHIGALFGGRFETQGSGNGTIVGLEVQSVEEFRVKGEPLKVVTNLLVSADEKTYRHQYGGAVRLTSVVRYAEPRQRIFFAQAGVQLGGVAFPDTPGTDDGYAKYLWRPVLGAGASFTRDEWSTVVDYQWHIKRKLTGQRNEVRDFRNRFTDGWTSGHRIAAANTIKLSERWLFLLNGATGWYTYQRNPSVYGATLGAVVHRFRVHELSVGIGRKY